MFSSTRPSSSWSLQSCSDCGAGSRPLTRTPTRTPSQRPHASLRPVHHVPRFLQPCLGRGNLAPASTTPGGEHRMSAIARFRRAGLVAGLLSLVPAVAFAHPGHGGAAGHDFLHGFMHPLHGMDHFLAMVAVGLWAAQRDRRSVWALPIAFVAFMAVGFVLGAGGVAMPAVELGIAASVLVLGIAVALAARIPTVGAVALVALFALFPGHAHGAELPAGMAASLFGAGFATSTALLHGAGIALAVGLRHAVMARSVGIERAIGAGIAAAGLALLLVCPSDDPARAASVVRRTCSGRPTTLFDQSR